MITPSDSPRGDTFFDRSRHNTTNGEYQLSEQPISVQRHLPEDFPVMVYPSHAEAQVSLAAKGLFLMIAAAPVGTVLDLETLEHFARFSRFNGGREEVMALASELVVAGLIEADFEVKA